MDVDKVNLFMDERRLAKSRWFLTRWVTGSIRHTAIGEPPEQDNEHNQFTLNAELRLLTYTSYEKQKCVHPVLRCLPLARTHLQHVEEAVNSDDIQRRACRAGARDFVEDWRLTVRGEA